MEANLLKNKYDAEINARERLQLWNWINEYVVACGGDPSDATISNRRMEAVSRIEGTVFEIADRHYKACRP